jgi:hypothetical protein
LARRVGDGHDMLFHVHHHHDEKTCPAHNAEAVSASFGAVLPALAENGVNVVGAWVDPPGHDFFFVLETDDYDALVEGLRPIIPSGTATIQPVGDMGATVAKRIAEES